MPNFERSRKDPCSVPRDELGSEWHTLLPEGAPVTWPWDEPRFFGTARAALIALVQQLQPPRLWMPSYACHGFYRAVEHLTELRIYRDLPGEVPSLPSDPEALVVVHNPFGLRGEQPLPEARWVLEDHTHAPRSPWAQCSKAHYSVASLRKTLPLPDGAVLWSPQGAALPAEPLPQTTDAVLRKRAGMDAKATWLAGGEVDKQAFRAQLAQGEAGLAHQVGMSPFSRQRLAELPDLRSVRAANFAVLAPWALPSDDPCPSFAVLRFDSTARRDRVRSRLIAAGIFPSALWPPELPVGPAEHGFFKTSFAIPVDVRATPATLERAAAILGSTETK